MPRMGRVVLPNYPHHVVQRGHNRQVVFTGEQDFCKYIDDLRELRDTFDVRVYAYCLMSNHVHLLLAPGENTCAVGQLMKGLAGRATRYRNRLEGRSGTLWEGRYRSSPVDTDTYLLACCRYIELNPVRAGMVADAADYPWSSLRQRVGLDGDVWIDRDPAYLSLGEAEAVRRQRYGRFMDEAVPDGEWKLIRQGIQRGQLTGPDRFARKVEKITGRRMERRGPGRPSRGAGK